jgi:hypothetical protein
MSTFDNTAFTEKIAALYAKQLTERLPGLKFQIVQRLPDIARLERIRVLGKCEEPPLRTINLDDYIRGEGSIDEETAANTISSMLSDEIIAYGLKDLRPEIDDAAKRIGAGQLYLYHEYLWLPLTLGCALVHIAKPHGIHLLGQTWYDANEMKTKYLTKAAWVLARTNEVREA